MTPTTQTKTLVVFGTRPKAIKIAPVVHALQSVDSIETVVCVTAQHRQMLDQALTLFDHARDMVLQNFAQVGPA